MADQNIAPAQAARDLLEQLNLHINQLEPVIICRVCSFTFSGSLKSFMDHVMDKHKHPRELAKDLGQLLRLYIIVGPKELRLRPDHASPHPHLFMHLGMMCKHCGLKTTGVNILARHLSKEHSRASTKYACWGVIPSYFHAGPISPRKSNKPHLHMHCYPTSYI
jgi:hypothetical protein